MGEIEFGHETVTQSSRKPDPQPPTYIGTDGQVHHTYGTNRDGSPKNHDDPLELSISHLGVAKRIMENSKSPEQWGAEILSKRNGKANAAPRKA